MKPKALTNIGLASSLLILVAGQSASAVPANLHEGFFLDSGENSGLWPTAWAGRNNFQLFSYSGGVSIYSAVSESSRGAWDGGVTLFGKPISFVLGAESETDTGTFDVWRYNPYFAGSGYSPVFRIDTAANTAAFNSVNVSVTGGSLSVTGGLNLTGTSGNGISVNGSSIFTIDSTGAVNFAAGKPVSITSTNVSGSSAAGALIVSGGIGAAKDSHVNGLRIGRGAGDLLWNTAVGGNALVINTTGNLVTAFGYNALAANTTANFNAGFGGFALAANTTGVNNTALGAATLQYLNGGTGNTAVGVKALNQGVTASYNTAMGTMSMFKTTGIANSALGSGALSENTSGSYNSVHGASSMVGNTVGSYNVALGLLSGDANTSGNGNVFLGANSGRYQGATGTTPLQTANNSIYIGYQSRGYSNSDSNSIVIGPNATGEGPNTTVIGNGDTTKTRLRGETNADSLKVAGKTTLEGKVVIAAPQGDISMGEYQ
ncbi:hypothetical protein JIN84_06080 [Luteolibacter yonseiensis]|uniref:Trimeric autotransporter adhesin YadA-like head domain-containing protein n=1 Tax=Luteolibacter yonseiensis TaxID=1144680 RepID=A0A934R1F3_9BACT|nr:hypothetical protein [Luteolibacter yonseiensis]MBK1815171.1 hypothetical protein [Luteolibacter yonseiensis]